MIGFKFLTSGAHGRFSRKQWPVPSANQPGPWLEASAPLSPCRHGIHACRIVDLAHWLDTELWEIELAGALLETPTMLVAERGRLLRRVDGWNAALQHDFGALCTARAQAVAEQATREQLPGVARAVAWAGHAAHFASSQRVATASYIAAVASSVVHNGDPDEAYTRERAAQSAWLGARLGLSAQR